MIREQNKPVVPKLVSRDRDKDMPDSLYDDVVKYAKEAFDSKYLDEKDVADFIKKKLEERGERDVCWHVIVGRHFGGFVTYTEKMYTYFYIGQMGFLIFATPEV